METKKPDPKEIEALQIALIKANSARIITQLKQQKTK
jgi:hypothetical protein